MKRRERIPVPVLIVSVLLILHVLASSANGPAVITRFLFVISPFLLIWMVISVVRSGPYTGKEFEEGEEWGYEDKQKADAGLL